MNTNREIVNGSADLTIHEEELRGSASSANSGGSPLSIWGPKLVALMLGICAMGAAHGAANAATIQNASEPCANPSERLPSLSPVQNVGWPDGLTSDLPTGIATVRIVLDAAATVKDVSVAVSSGDPTLDWDAMEIASAARFEPGTGDCGGRGGAYLFVVDAR